MRVSASRLDRSPLSSLGQPRLPAHSVETVYKHAHAAPAFELEADLLQSKAKENLNAGHVSRGRCISSPSPAKSLWNPSGPLNYEDEEHVARCTVRSALPVSLSIDNGAGVYNGRECGAVVYKGCSDSPCIVTCTSLMASPDSQASLTRNRGDLQRDSPGNNRSPGATAMFFDQLQIRDEDMYRTAELRSPSPPLPPPQRVQPGKNSRTHTVSTNTSRTGDNPELSSAFKTLDQFLSGSLFEGGNPGHSSPLTLSPASCVNLTPAPKEVVLDRSHHSVTLTTPSQGKLNMTQHN